MTTPSDPADIEAEALRRFRKIIKQKLATMPPEEGRKWLERLLARLLGDEVIVSASEPGED